MIIASGGFAPVRAIRDVKRLLDAIRDSRQVGDLGLLLQQCRER